MDEKNTRVKPTKKKGHTKDAPPLSDEGREIISAIETIKEQLIEAKQRFDAATDDALIDCCIYEIIALNKKYEYFLKAAKKLGLVADITQKIG